MMYVYERMMDRLVKDRHASLAELYDSSQRPGVMASRLGSVLIRVGGWLRRDVEVGVPELPGSVPAKLRTGGC